MYESQSTRYVHYPNHLAYHDSIAQQNENLANKLP